eukprot:tig00000104_g4815.t1
MSEADRRRETRAPPGADSADALSERFGLDRRLFNVPGGILAVGYCPERSRSGTAQIRKYQKTFNPLIRFAPFERLVKEIADDEKKRRVEAGFTAEDLRWSKDAILAMREAAEMHAINVLGGANLLALHRNRITIQPKDIQLRRRIREEESG